MNILDDILINRRRYKHSFGTVSNIAGMIFGIFFITIGIIIPFFESYFYCFFIIMGILVIFTKASTIIDFDNNKSREILSVFGLKFGTWRKLENLSHIQILNHFESRTLMSNVSSSKDLKSEVHIIYIVKKNISRIKAAQFDDIEIAKDVAKEFGKRLNIDCKF